MYAKLTIPEQPKPISWWYNIDTKTLYDEVLKTSTLTPNDKIENFYIEFVLYILKHTYKRSDPSNIYTQNKQYININKSIINTKTYIIKDILNELIRSGYFITDNIPDLLYCVMLDMHESLGGKCFHCLEFSRLQVEVRKYINGMNE